MSDAADVHDIPTASSEGRVDAIKDGRIYGWAWDPSEPDRRLVVDVFHADAQLGSATADRFREDLRQSEVGDGRHAFVFDLPSELRAARPAEFCVYFEGTDVLLERGPRLAPTMLEAVDAAGGSVLVTLQHRVERLEAAAVKLINVITALDEKLDGRGGTVDWDAESGEFADPIRRIEQRLEQAAIRIDDAAKSITSMEGFLVRFDERLRELPAAGQITAIERRLASKPGRIYLIVMAIATAALVLGLSDYWTRFVDQFRALLS